MGLMIKAMKYSGWLLLLLMVLYIATGLAYAGYPGFDMLIDMGTATWIHSNLVLLGVLLLSLFTHCCLRVLSALRKRSKGPGTAE